MRATVTRLPPKAHLGTSLKASARDNPIAYDARILAQRGAVRKRTDGATSKARSNCARQSNGRLDFDALYSIMLSWVPELFGARLLCPSVIRTQPFELKSSLSKGRRVERVQD